MFSMMLSQSKIQDTEWETMSMRSQVEKLTISAALDFGREAATTFVDAYGPLIYKYQ